MAGIHSFKSFTIGAAGVQISVDMERFTRQFNEAQFKLDSMIMSSMEPKMPFRNGDFINATKSESASMAGTGWVCAGKGIHARYLYEGKVMVDAKTGKGPMKITDKFGGFVLRYHKGAKLKATGRSLTYSNGRQSHWFDAAKASDLNMWVRETKKIAGGG